MVSAACRTGARDQASRPLRGQGGARTKVLSAVRKGGGVAKDKREDGSAGGGHDKGGGGQAFSVKGCFACRNVLFGQVSARTSARPGPRLPVSVMVGLGHQDRASCGTARRRATMAGGAASGFGEPRAAVERAARVLCNEGPASRCEAGWCWVRLGGAQRVSGGWVKGEERESVKRQKDKSRNARR